ncbi:MAG: DEAD/DEAH box helicase [Chloroflexia bacterium]|nr:DEAD/DEAH box helicase [Chloroflexia bacterium]
MSTFRETGLKPEIISAIELMGFEKPTPIQEKTIPALLESENDILALAQTGTGKTAAFGLPVLNQIDLNDKNVQALVLCPTRELCVQISKDIESFSANLKGLKTVAVYGGANITNQIKDLKAGGQIVVGTPGRTLDLIKRKALKINKISWLVLDEADEMLNMGFIDDIETILSKLDSQRKVWMFSATMPAPIMKIVKNMFKEPKTVKVAKKTLSNESIEQFYCLLDKRSFKEGLCRFLQTEKDPYAIIFCETREETKFMAEYLSDRNMPSVALHGDLTQKDRDFSMDKFRTKRATILVCTDVAARGIDIQDITHVINYGIPRNLDS